MRARLLVAVAVLLAGCGVEAPADHVRQPIVGGTVDTTTKYPAVFVVKVEHSGGPTAGCTATLITPRTLLTAAHCLPPDTTKISTTNITPAPASSPTFVESTEYRRHPSWTSGNPAANDIGLILLPTASTLTPYPYDRADLTGFTGKPLTAVGYGVTTSGGSDNGTRRYVDLTFRSVTAAHIVLGNQSSKGVCFGDSGGPALHTFPDGVTRVVGVHSYTQPSSSCTDGLDTRVDLYGAFIRTWLMDKEGGGTCVEDGMCKAGCAPADPDCVCVADGTCSAQCANLLSDPDCPPDCAMNGVCTTLACPAPDPDCLGELAQCTADTQCAMRHCTTDPQRPAERYCARSCANQAACAAGTTCTGGVCLKLQKPSIAPGAGCAAATDFCLGGTTCQAVPMGGTRCTIPCTAATTCPVPTACSAGFCLGGDVKVAAPGEVCDQAKTYCTGNTVCAGLAVLGPPTCTEGCVVSDDCTVKTKICQQGIGGVSYCENEILVLPQLTEVSGPAGKTGCSASGASLLPFAALLWLRQRRWARAG